MIKNKSYNSKQLKNKQIHLDKDFQEKKTHFIVGLVICWLTCIYIYICISL